MNEKGLIKNWNTLRSNIIQAQFASVIILAVVVYLAVAGDLASASDEIKIFTLTVLATTGILSLVTQFAAIREAGALAKDLKKAETHVGKLISVSDPYLKLTQVVMGVFGIAVFVLLVVALY